MSGHLNNDRVRIFVDTNVLIEFFENLDNNPSKQFLEEASSDDRVELLTSDFVIFEVLEFLRREYYIKSKIDGGWCTRRAYRKSRNFENFSQADFTSMKKEINNHMNKIAEIVEIIPLEEFIDKNLGISFSEIVKHFILSTKIEKNDVLALTSALLTQSHVFLTKDEDFAREGRRIAMLEEFLKELPIPLSIKFFSPKPPNNLSIREYIKKIYEKVLGENARDSTIL